MTRSHPSVPRLSRTLNEHLQYFAELGVTGVTRSTEDVTSPPAPRSLDDVAMLAMNSLPDHLQTEDRIVERMTQLATLAEIQRWMEDQILASVRQVLAEAERAEAVGHDEART